MPVAKLRSSSTDDDGNDFLDNFIKEAIGKEPYLSFSRTRDNPVQWVQLLNALDHQDHPGWPLLTPLKVQMQKCDKCSREFCSSINYRRHIRVHRRSLNPDKDSTVSKNSLGAFWDKLSFDDAKETVTLNSVSLEEVPGSSIVQALTSLIRRPGFSNLPQAYLKAGSALLDVVQARASLFPISSHEFFSILDDASEKTFLCGTAVSLQKYVFDGEAGKIGLEMRNIVACTSFLVEQKLIEAWVAEKNAEALRCQKLLVEEEEAAERRKVDLLERKRQKKLRQKEQKAKEQAGVKKADSKQGITVDLMSIVPPTEMPASLVALDSDSRSPVSPPGNNPSFCEPDRLWTSEQDVDGETPPSLSSAYSDLVSCQDDEERTVQGCSSPELVMDQCQMPKAQCGVPDGIIHSTTQNAQVSKSGAKQRHGAHREPRAGLIFNGNKVWTPKPKTEKDELGFNKHMPREAVSQPVQNKSCEVLIGSISVALGSCSNQVSSLEVQDDCLVENQMLKKNSVQLKSQKTDSGYGAVNRAMVKHWRPIGRHETRGDAPHMKSDIGISEMDAVTENASDRTLSDESCLTSCAMDETCSGREVNSVSPTEGKSADLGDLQFSIRAAEAFLAQRWKEAIAAEHAELVLSPESEPPECPMARNDTQAAESLLLDSSGGRRVLVSAENCPANGTVFESSTTGVAKANPRTKPERGGKLKYIPKQRTIP